MTSFRLGIDSAPNSGAPWTIVEFIHLGSLRRVVVECVSVQSLTVLLDSLKTFLSITLCLVLLGVVFSRKLYRQLVFLTAYVIVLTPAVIAWIWLSRSPLLNTHGGFLYYWTANSILTFLRLFILAEICWRVLHDYHVVWTLTRRALAGIAAFLLLVTAYFLMQHWNDYQGFILTLQQGLDFTQAVLLLVLMSVGIYYQIRISPLYRLVLVGSCIYSAVQLTNSQLGRYTKVPTDSIFDFVQHFTFILMLGIWIWAVWRWADLPEKPAIRINQSTYDRLSAEIHSRLALPNESLMKMLRRDSK